MTTSTPTKPERHNWTKQEIAHLKRTVSSSKNKTEAFKKIADEMGIDHKRVASTYYANNKKPAKAAKQAQPAAKVSTTVNTSAVQMGRPYDFTSYSEGELHEFSQAINFEVNRRIEALRELEVMFSKG